MNAILHPLTWTLLNALMVVLCCAIYDGSILVLIGIVLNIFAALFSGVITTIELYLYLRDKRRNQ
jgi:hypothetical protein